MFSELNSIQDIISNTDLMEMLPVFFPDRFIEMVPEEMRRLPLNEVHQKITMPWGAPYVSDMLINAANTTLQIKNNNLYTIVQLWKNKNPQAQLFIKNIKNDSEKMPPVLICPGGGYEDLSMVGEGTEIADAMEERGFKPFILRYRVKPAAYPEPQMDFVMAVKYIRSHADELNIDPDRLLAAGFSAGGHLAATSAGLYNEINQELTHRLSQNEEKAEDNTDISGMPDNLCLGYPLITFLDVAGSGYADNLTGGKREWNARLSAENTVTEDFPRTYIWTCEDDGLIPYRHSEIMGDALKKNQVEYKLHIYPEGDHGCGIAKGTSAEGWLDEMVNFVNKKE